MSDEVLEKIVDYVLNTNIESEEAFETAKDAFADALGCAMLALQFPACTRLLGPIIPNTQVPGGSSVPGTPYILDPVTAAFNFGTMIRWLDFNDTWLAVEWGHPSDNIGGIWAILDFMSQKKTITGKDLLVAMIKAYEIQGILALENSFNQVGLDHVILVKVATAAVTSALLGCSSEQVMSAISNAWIDLGPLRTYRHAPCTGSRKSWAAGDATSRGVFFAWLASKGEMGYPHALTAKRWGLQDVLFDGKPIILSQPLGSYVIENVLFKISFPAEFHGQTAVEAAIQLHPLVKDRFDEILEIRIQTQESAMRIINKEGPLKNPADRDHCLQYMVAIGLLHGHLVAEHYENEAASDPRVDALRLLMKVEENRQYSRDYLDPQKRSIANKIQIFFRNGEKTPELEVEYPIGHRKRRKEGKQLLFEKCQKNLRSRFSEERVDQLMALFTNRSAFEKINFYEMSKFFLPKRRDEETKSGNLFRKNRE